MQAKWWQYVCERMCEGRSVNLWTWHALSIVQEVRAVQTSPVQQGAMESARQWQSQTPLPNLQAEPPTPCCNAVSPATTNTHLLCVLVSTDDSSCLFVTVHSLLTPPSSTAPGQQQRQRWRHNISSKKQVDMIKTCVRCVLDKSQIAEEAGSVQQAWSAA
jgi:hypothetical protein